MSITVTTLSAGVYRLSDSASGQSIDVHSSTDLSADNAAATQVFNDVVFPGTSLQSAQMLQTQLLSAKCQNAILTGMTSSALGASNSYPLNGPYDQQNLTASMSAAGQGMAKPATWSAGLTLKQYDVILDGGVYYICITAGTTGSTKPTWPTAFQVDVTDGTATVALAGWLISTANGSEWHTPAQVIQVWRDYLAWVNTCRSKYRTLKDQVKAATTVSAVQAIVW